MSLGSNPVPWLVHPEQRHIRQTEQGRVEERCCPGNAHVPDKGHAERRTDHSGKLLPQLTDITSTGLTTDEWINSHQMSSQNTQEKFGSEPEDCDQKEMYKLLVSTVTCRLQCSSFTRVVRDGMLIVCAVFPMCRKPTSPTPRPWSYSSSASATSPCQSLNSSSAVSAASLSWGW